MKLYQPLFSIIIIFIQLILSLIGYYYYIQWGIENPELNELVNRMFEGGYTFLSVLFIGILEMLTKPSWFKTFIRIFLITYLLGILVSELIFISGFYSGIYVTICFSGIIAFLLILAKIIIHLFKKLQN